MKVEHIRPFAKACVHVCAALLDVSPERGALAVRPILQTSQQINVVCVVGGSVRGHVVLGMSARTASRIAARMIGNPVVTFNTLAASAIGEFANMIGGRSLTMLENLGLECSLTPPVVVRGTRSLVLGATGPAIAIPLVLAEFGAIEIQVSLGGLAAAA